MTTRRNETPQIESVGRRADYLAKMVETDPRVLVDEAQQAAVRLLGQTPRWGASGSEKAEHALAAGMILSLGAAGSGAVPWWTPLAPFLVLLAAAMKTAFSAEPPPMFRAGADDGSSMRFPRDGHAKPSWSPVLLGLAGSVVAGAASGLWWSAVPITLAIGAWNGSRRHRWRRSFADLPAWPVAQPQAGCAEKAFADPIALQFAAALAVVASLRPLHLTDELGLDEDGAADAISGLTRSGHAHVFVWTKGNVNLHVRFTKSGRAAWRRHLSTL